MLTFTDAARETILALMREGYTEHPALRVAVAPGCSPLAPEYELSLVDEAEESPDDVVVDGFGFKVLVDLESAGRLQGATVDYVQRELESGFEVRAANTQLLAGGPPAGPLAERVQEVIERQINPAIAAHGGRIALVDVRENVVYLQMSGGCQGCGMARVTLSQGVERMIKQAVPEIVAIQDVTDHLAGSNPYFATAK
ncbi:MAG: NifU family protein [Gemmatimonadetes bacterium]|nr:NifU family protein [Gemmatimonadota bacterium]